LKKEICFKYSFLALIIFFNVALPSEVAAAKFYSVNDLFGISFRVTNSICKDDNGFIWASSKTGIIRLTDNNYRIYHLPYETSGAVVVTLNYTNSKLIAFTNNGQIFTYNPVHDRFDLVVDLRKSIKDDRFNLYTLLIDQDGVFWIALNSGLYKYYKGKLSLIKEIARERFSITWYNEKQLIIAEPGGLWLFNINTLESNRIFENKSIKPFLVSAFLIDKIQNKLWVGTFSNGLFCYDFKTSTLSSILQSSFPRQPVLAIRENSASAVLVGVDGQGVWEISKTNSRVINIFKEDENDPYSLRGNGVYDLYCDEGKRVWICTISGGVSYYDLASPLVNQVVHRINDNNSLVNNNVNDVLEDRNGNIWFATDNGISRWNTTIRLWKNFYFNKLDHSQVFLTLCEDNEGRIWAGSYSSGIYVLDSVTGRELAHYSSNDKVLPVISDFIFDIFKDSQGDLWIGGVDGKLPCYLSKEKKFITYSEEPISVFAEFSPGQILIGGSNSAKILNKETGEIKEFLPGYEIQDILVLDDEIWICTSGEGLLEYSLKSRVLKKYTSKDGLPSDFVNSIAFADNNLWIGTENGLCRLNPINKTVTTFSSIVPLSGLSYNKCALYRLRNGQLAGGTNNGVIIFPPESVKDVASKGRIFFQGLTISGRSITGIPSFKLNTPVDSLNSIELKHSQNTISLELISVGLGSKFSWKLEGFDNDWFSPSENRIITYTNIPSGKYELKIKLYDNSLSNVVAERSLSIKSIPPFLKTGWFWMIVILTISGITLLYLMYYINKLKQEHTEEKVRFFTNTVHDIRTSLTLIKAPVEELTKEKGLTESGKYYLNLAIAHARQLASVVTQLMDFQKVDIGKEHLSLSMNDIVKFVSNRKIMLSSYADSKNIELLFNSDCESYMTAFDEPKMEKIIDNLITNAIKYSNNNSQVVIDLKCGSKNWTIRVKDNGIGISRKDQRQLFKEFYRGDNAVNTKVVGSGIGLMLVKSYVAIHGGNITCDSQENAGSTFQVMIPFKTTPKESESISVPSGTGITSGTEDEDTLQIESEGKILTTGETKILIVEDNENLLNFIKGCLSDYFKVVTAIDGKDAWKYILKHTPDLIVSDIMMPEMDGFELCKLVKSTYETSHIPVILLTALSEKTDQLHGLGLGADDYLTKPFDMVILVQRIRSIIQNRTVVREKAFKLINGNTNDHIHANELNNKFIKKIMEVVKANISNSGFGKDEFASRMNVSSSLLYKKVKSLTGLSPTDLIKTIRLKYALEMLQTGKYSVTEVSEHCGFTSLTYFGIAFKKHFGKSPSDVMQ